METQDQRIEETPHDIFRLFNVPLYDAADLQELLLRFGINLLFAFCIIRLIYYTFHKHREYLFTFFLFNSIIFFVCALLRNLQLSMGFAFGLFALFGLLRYRTQAIPITEMTYLFIVICIGMINAMFSRRVSYAEFISANVIILAFTYVLEKLLSRRMELEKRINYEKIDLIRPENHDKLLEDLRQRTGLNIHRFHIQRINFLRDTARIIVYYTENPRDSKNSKSQNTNLK